VRERPREGHVQVKILVYYVLMKLLDTLALAFRTVKSNKLRTGITVSIIAFGIMALVGINTAIDATGASRVIVTHGQVAIMVRWLTERGLSAQAFETEFDNAGENDVAAADTPDAGALGATDAYARAAPGTPPAAADA